MNNKNNNWKFNASTDSEYHLFDNLNGEFCESISVLKTDKYNPLDLKNSVLLYSDNILVESQIKISYSRQEMIDNVRDMLQKITNYIHNIENGRYKLIAKAAHVYDEKHLKDPVSREIGCSPEYSIWPRPRIVPRKIFKNFLRSCGGHVSLSNGSYKNYLNQYGNIECEKDTPLLCDLSKIKTIKLCDLFLGVPFTLIDNDKSSNIRKTLYGKAGSFRPKIFGVEYRCLNCIWTSSPELTGLIWDLSEFMINLIKENKSDKYLSIKNRAICSAINSNDKELCLLISKQLDLPDNIWKQIHECKEIGVEENSEGIQYDLYENWNIKPESNKNQLKQMDLVEV